MKAIKNIKASLDVSYHSHNSRANNKMLAQSSTGEAKTRQSDYILTQNAVKATQLKEKFRKQKEKTLFNENYNNMSLMLEAGR